MPIFQGLQRFFCQSNCQRRDYTSNPAFIQSCMWGQGHQIFRVIFSRDSSYKFYHGATISSAQTEKGPCVKAGPSVQLHRAVMMEPVIFLSAFSGKSDRNTHLESGPLP